MLKPLLLAAAALVAAAPATAATAPRVSIQNLGQLKTPLPFPYDEHADANRAVAAAKAQARRSHKKLLIDLGGNWCGDCRVLAGFSELPEIKAFLDRHYVIVTVDVGRFDKNLQVPAHYGLTKRLDGVPTLLIVDPRSDRLVNRGNLFALTDARHMTPQALADYLAKWA